MSATGIIEAAIRGAGGARPPAAATRTIAAVLNAFIETVPPPGAGAIGSPAPAADGAGAGVLVGAPIAVKANLCAEGFLATAGSKMLHNYRAPYSATAVERLQAAGGVMCGITNMDEFGMGSSTSFSAHGPTFNPHSALFALLAHHQQQLSLSSGGDAATTAGSDSTGTSTPSPAAALAGAASWLTPGGSSGGSAVAVATGAAAAALGSDTGGSVRQPASFCGVVGFKPSYGRIPRWGLIPYASSLDTVGVLARSVGDAAALYDVVAGHDPRDDTCVRLPRAPPTVDALRAAGHAYSLTRRRSAGSATASGDEMWSLAGLRVGVPEEYHVKELDAATADAWARGASLLAAHGATVVPVRLPHTPAALPAYYVLAPAESASNLSRYDGVRYGYRAADAPPPGAGAAGGRAGAADGIARADPAAALHELIARTRSEGFGAEVQRRLMTGNFVLSAEARGSYYDSARHVRRLVAADFHAAFRPRSGDGGGEGAQQTELMTALTPRATGCAPPDAGVDVLLVPTAPGHPWRSGDTAGRDPLSVYLGDVLTIPASLAGLPALSVPVGTVPYPEGLLGQALEEAAAAGIRTSTHAVGALAASLALPVGLQVIGRWLDEDTVLRVGAVLERAAGYAPPAWLR